MINKFEQSENLIFYPLDITSEISRSSCVKKINDNWGSIHILINNAGICYRSVLEEMQEKDELKQIETNYLGPLSLIRLVLPEMRRRKGGKIINISSVGAGLSMPTMGSYSASKFALEAAMEALWYETKSFNISINLVQPSFVRSDSYKKVKFSASSQLSFKTERPYSNLYLLMIPLISKCMESALSTPESIAKIVYKAANDQNHDLWISGSIDAQFLHFFKRIFPRNLFLKFSYQMLNKIGGLVKIYIDRIERKSEQTGAGCGKIKY